MEGTGVTRPRLSPTPGFLPGRPGAAAVTSALTLQREGGRVLHQPLRPGLRLVHRVWSRHSSDRPGEALMGQIFRQDSPGSLQPLSGRYYNSPRVLSSPLLQGISWNVSPGAQVSCQTHRCPRKGSDPSCRSGLLIPREHFPISKPRARTSDTGQTRMGVWVRVSICGSV